MRAAVFTIVQHEEVFFPVWRDYYLRHFSPGDVHVLHHELPAKAEWDRWLRGDASRRGYRVVPVSSATSFDHEWLRLTVMNFQRELHKTYDVTLFTEVDEVVTTRPDSGDLRDYINSGFDGKPVATCYGYEVVHKYDSEPPLDPGLPLLPQRNWWYPSTMYSKPVLCREPQSYCQGFHACDAVPVTHRARDPRLLLIHLHKIDFDICLSRNTDNASRLWKEGEAIGAQNRIDRADRLRRWWWMDIDQHSVRSCLVPIPGIIKSVL